ncbi:MAG: terminase small subunit [Ruminococcus sp.]|nr:terminase small subunit [Ruminococcus sp.]
MNHQMSKSTTKKNRNHLFCCYYVNCGNVEEVARKADFPIETAAMDGADLLRKSVYQKMVADYRQALQNETMAQVKTGLERLSFGRCNDVLQLLLTEETLTSCEIQSLDLYSVASIKRD